MHIVRPIGILRAICIDWCPLVGDPISAVDRSNSRGEAGSTPFVWRDVFPDHFIRFCNLKDPAGGTFGDQGVSVRKALRPTYVKAVKKSFVPPGKVIRRSRFRSGVWLRVLPDDLQ